MLGNASCNNGSKGLNGKHCHRIPKTLSNALDPLRARTGLTPDLQAAYADNPTASLSLGIVRRTAMFGAPLTTS